VVLGWWRGGGKGGEGMGVGREEGGGRREERGVRVRVKDG